MISWVPRNLVAYSISTRAVEVIDVNVVMGVELGFHVGFACDRCDNEWDCVCFPSCSEGSQ